MIPLLKKTKTSLEQNFQKVQKAPENFDLYEAIHDFVECIELDSSFADTLTYRTKMSREMNIPTKYGYLKQVYQGLEDASAKTTKDLGHARYANIRDLKRIQNNEFSESNFFWKKRAVFRKLTNEIYLRLQADFDLH